uniref:ethanolamine kinase n=1 Tax=Chromera velia CCMP2878 TaxID=1169474 RepID=A0A0G4HGT6_9ALVE|eukprot:Cvel_6777.t1-p1 / transcript=Cvel_6777.t1 / gene=Cvel_6777 / organism=Chromera_velia_CCMP2878 / gene_product=Probable ethanolamine kinase A, putative / transcript_product=Probable ethanolamine kinase A, putative / location=Cvel_scaffold340:53698-54762(-) / protein_length=355 / sequence_SO=supercontig / SO=protein_coding / is_pseudo=false
MSVPKRFPESLKVDGAPDGSVEERAKEIIAKDFAEAVGTGDSSLLDWKEVKGGITNRLLKIFKRDAPDEAVLVRVFGPKTEKMIDREREEKVLLHLSAKGFGASVLGIFEDGRIEQWLLGRTPEPLEMKKPEVAAQIAQALQKFHASDAPPSVSLDRSCLWDTLHGWINACRTAVKEADEGKDLRGKKLGVFDFERVAKELDAAEKRAKTFSSPLVLCHNDLLSGNVFLKSGANGGVTFIDFEYSTCGERAFDIANHWCECVGFECEWENFHSEEEQRHFIRHYLSIHEGRDEEVERVRKEALAFVPVSHLFWGSWACLQALHSEIDFDFYGYGFKRLSALFSSEPRSVFASILA